MTSQELSAKEAATFAAIVKLRQMLPNLRVKLSDDRALAAAIGKFIKNCNRAQAVRS